MTPYIEAKKAEIRAKFKPLVDLVANCHDGEHREQAYRLIDQTIDTLLDEIEGRVVPMEALPSDWDDDDKPRLRASMYNQCRKDVSEAFQHLRTGVETE